MTLLSDLQLHLVIVGDGPERGNMEALARSLGVDGRVRFAGYREDVGNAYGAMDVFALVSAREGFGLVVAEAMLAELPVIATAVGGIRDIVEPGQSGLLIDPKDPAAVAGAIRELYGDPALRQRLASAGQRRAREHFSAERYAADVDAFYRRLLKR
jgi:glycosyltransferase involved in cell wall biosynthesis